MNNRSLIVTAARAWLGVRETSRNRFPGDVALWASTSNPDGYEDREPYCAAAVCHWIALAAWDGMPLSGPLPKMARVRDWVPWAEKHGHMIVSNRFTPMPGDIVSLWPHVSHIGVATGRVIDGKIETIEGNTDDGGSREGDGFYIRLRSRSIIGSVIRLTLKGEKL